MAAKRAKSGPQTPAQTPVSPTPTQTLLGGTWPGAGGTWPSGGMVDLRPSPSRALVNPYDEPALDRGLGQAADLGMQVALPLGLAALGGPAGLSLRGMAPSLIQSLLGPFTHPDPEVLTGQTAWKARGISPSVIEALGTAPESPLHSLINQRNTVFHATTPASLPEILNAGEIHPDPSLLAGYGARNSAELAAKLEAVRAQGMTPMSRGAGADTGVSVSRAPGIDTKMGKGVSLMIDRDQMPPNRPLAEPGYGKTDTRTGVPNKWFEFEDRTYGSPIPASAAREIWVDQGALRPPSSAEVILDDIRRLAGAQNLPVRVFPNRQAMQSGRAQMGRAQMGRAQR